VKVTVYVYCDAQPTVNSTVKFVWQETFLVKLWFCFTIFKAYKIHQAQ